MQITTLLLLSLAGALAAPLEERQAVGGSGEALQQRDNEERDWTQVPPQWKRDNEERDWTQVPPHWKRDNEARDWTQVPPHWKRDNEARDWTQVPPHWKRDNEARDWTQVPPHWKQLSYEGGWRVVRRLAARVSCFPSPSLCCTKGVPGSRSSVYLV
ncbi:hypothetical protein A1Q1_03114 [Trichosporon asahii var. asahii CBS 2479]|uniref:Uncharacterized protein n=1 Tax=Trichosporon asahii var. asahii (strain ATCC 90039 / CBS 2479 / JCM 2466 / KCTC 7840 / NBRC 103889/ NCYC 2677 / UAMH 7654) TaxID=1186058 RepID=J4UL47_TRIAS|nr:hypothetical protein A1Q1_03114 [Trichosporon asahii var. asahii CBS 2479]EJT52660.1 hypothetical protein A1Q1_03114 [Trichosporon asahii var. asahii CBS 2479]